MEPYSFWRVCYYGLHVTPHELALAVEQNQTEWLLQVKKTKVQGANLVGG